MTELLVCVWICLAVISYSFEQIFLKA